MIELVLSGRPQGPVKATVAFCFPPVAVYASRDGQQSLLHA